MDNISKHISYNEAVNSSDAIKFKIDNTPTADTLASMKIVANKCFEPIREHFDIPLMVTSFYRSDKLNKAIKGSKTSQHVKGQAIDFVVQFAYSPKNKEILEWAKDNLDYDQLINEYPDKNGNPCWIHISYNDKGKNRKQFFTVS